MYSQIPFIRHARDRSAAELSNISDYQSVPVLAYVTRGNVPYCSYAWAVMLIKGVFHFGVSLSAVSESSKSSKFSGVFITEELATCCTH